MRLCLGALGVLLSAIAAGCGADTGSAAQAPSPSPTPFGVVQHHNGPRRDGLYVQPTLTRSAAAGMKLDPTFAGSLDGNVYAQPLYVENGPGGRGAFFVATESDNVFALDETTGAPVWARSLGTPAGATGAGCGNIFPLGVTGTPAIDLGRRTIYLDAVTGGQRTIDKHLIHALSIDDGSERSGWPVDPATLSFQGVAFDPIVQNQRGALVIANGMLYVPYGGHAGDCGDYHGWVVAVPLDAPGSAAAWRTRAVGGGIWAPGGLASDGSSVFAITGNTFGAQTWADGEAVVRLTGGASFSGGPRDYFAPSNWQRLDDADADIGGSGPLLVDVPGATPSALAVSLSKSGLAYLLDRTNLGGIGHGDGTRGEGLFSAAVADGAIINAAAAYTTGSGVHVVFAGYGRSRGLGCPAGQAGGLVALRLQATSPPSLAVAWCADNQGGGSPIVTTTGGGAEALVWTSGAEGSRRLHGWDAETGALVFAGGGDNELMSGLRRFGTPIAVKGRIFVGADNRLYAFTAQ